MKVVYNACHGGFGLSDKAVRRYAEIKGLTLYPEEGTLKIITYWLVPKEQRTGCLSGDAWYAASREEQMTSNQRYDELTLRPRQIPRHDPVLVQVVEELGKEANAGFARLQIRDVPAGSRYRIDEYDGSETVMLDSEYEWQVAE